VSTPDAEALHEACRHAGLDCTGARLIRRHANATYHLPAVHAVGRVGGSWDASRRARTSLAVTRWLLARGFPSAEPLDVDQPVDTGDRVVTFWRYYPPDPTHPPSTRDLARLLRALHTAPHPPFPLRQYEPLRSFATALAAARWLPAEDQQFLEQRREQLLGQYAGLEFVLPTGLIHGDADLGNLLRDRGTVRLGDWDGVCTGPREQDLALTHQAARFGAPPAQQQAFAREYGYDVTTWPGYPTLRDIHELHTLTSFLRLAPTANGEVRHELTRRIHTLRTSDHQTRWVAH